MFLRLRYFAEYAVVRIIVCVLQSMSLETCARFARFMAWFLTDVVPARARDVEENLRRAFPEWNDDRRTTCRRKMWEHLFLFVAEIAHAPRRIRITNYRRHIDFRQREIFCRTMFDDRGVIFVTAHFGVFEMLSFNSGLTGFPNYAVTRQLDNPYLEEFVRRFRSATGQHLIHKDGAADDMLRVLEGGGQLGILADQYAGTKGCWVEFFGHPASAHKAIALLSLANDVPLVVCSCRRTTGPLHFEQQARAVFDPRTAPPEMQDVKAITQWFTTEFENFVRETPEQYWWLHRRWKDNRPARRRAREAAPASQAAA